MPRYSHLILLSAVLAAMAAPAMPQGSCGPGRLGQPCGLGGIATAPAGEPALNLGVGNPIHLVTGNKYQHELDLPPNPAAPGLELVRHYNSFDTRPSVLGRGWALSYDTRLYFAAGHWQIAQADGSRVIYSATKTEPPTPQANRHGTLQRSAQEWIWTWPGGHALRFDRTGRLVGIKPPRQAETLIQRHDAQGPLAGAISQIINPAGGRLSFGYSAESGPPRVDHIDSPLGRFRYAYEPLPARADPARSSGELRLTAVIRPDGMQRRYLYEPELQAGNPGHLTGIQIATPDGSQVLRTNTWAFDPQGRAIRSAAGGPGGAAQALSIEYERSPGSRHTGITVVTGPAGHKTRFLTALSGAGPVLLRVDGAPCGGCAAPGSRASYDVHGRLTSINGLTIERRSSGAIQRLEYLQSGWPGLELRYLPGGVRDSWTSDLTGTEKIAYGERRLPTERAFANGDRWTYRYDADGRPVEIQHANAGQSQTTSLQWRAGLLARIGHDHENESRHYDVHQRLIRRTIERPLPGSMARSDSPRSWTDEFHYDAQHRVTEHRLPEGGSLHYEWADTGRLAGIEWRDAAGRAHTVFKSRGDAPGYEYGNGLLLQVRINNGQASELRLEDQARTVWSQRQHYNEQGLLRHERHEMPQQGHVESWRYAYNARHQLAGAQAPGDPPIWYSWNAEGSLAAKRMQGQTVRFPIQRDPSGLPVSLQGRQLRYGANRRLVQVHERGRLLEAYVHNARGQRISRQSGSVRTEYFYLDNRVAAESHNGTKITRRYIHAHNALVGFIDYPARQLYWVHADLIGAPRLVTDLKRDIRWLASYSPTGQAQRIAGDLTLDLRLPGQVFDASTGWHDNHLRTYLPASGHYLEPDPLGPVPGSQALGYANQQPRRHVDPLGLLLFAFDGTRSDSRSQTNVWKMSQYYQDGPVFYQSGPGTPGQLDWDAISARNAPPILERQWQALLGELSLPANRGDTIPIDIIGFSRGAALARHFGNMIDKHLNHGYFSYQDTRLGLVTACVDLRFMGLFDTVAQFGLLGSQNTNYDLSISAAWQWVAHAVALHERRWVFPLTSAGDNAAYNTIEAPFIGAHADIGGGVSYDDSGQPSSRGDLSDVTLNWMLWQARAASLRFSTPEAADLEITDPIVHDLRSPLARTIQNGDRRIDAADGSVLNTYQDDHVRLGRAQRDATEKLIVRADDWRSRETAEVGTVDMDGYAQWLHDEVGWRALPA